MLQRHALLASSHFRVTTVLYHTGFPNPYSTQAAGPCFWRTDHSDIFTITIQQTPRAEKCKAVVLTFYMKINVFGDVLQLTRTGTHGKVTYRAGSEATYCFPRKNIQ